jgi:AmiR/NasT family two-component response regulator
MQRALASRSTIEQAKGILMAEKGISPDEAFQELVTLSGAQESKVRVVAAEIVARATG